MDPFIFLPSIDGMLVEFDPSSSYQNSVNGPAFSEESVSSNYMELEDAPNYHPNPNQYSNIPYFAANANMDYFNLYQMNLFYQLNLHYFFGLPLFPISIPWLPVYVPYFYIYLASIYPIGGEGAALVPPSTAPTGPADVSEGLSPPFL